MSAAGKRRFFCHILGRGGVKSGNRMGERGKSVLLSGWSMEPSTNR